MRRPYAGRMDVAGWLEHFRANSVRNAGTAAAIDWGGYRPLSRGQRAAFVRSFQRFELGESGDGAQLLAKASAAGDTIYAAALELLVLEEQGHSALFRRGLDYLGAPTLSSHWSDAAFTSLRRAFGLRTELGLFLIAETVAMGYFLALADRAPDPVLRAIGRRIASDERNHIRFQIDRLRLGFRGTPRVIRAAVRLSWMLIAAGAATVVVVDHAAALRACGVSPGEYWGRAMRQFRLTSGAVFAGARKGPLGPLVPPR